jgi:hypothetical protein
MLKLGAVVRRCQAFPPRQAAAFIIHHFRPSLVRWLFAEDTGMSTTRFLDDVFHQRSYHEL